MLERELERERRPEPFGGPGNAEMGAEDGVLLPLTVSKPSTTLFLPYANPSLDPFDRVSIPEVIPCPSLCV